MTFEDDFIQIEFGGTRRFSCMDLGLEWPPPETLTFGGTVWVRDSISAITDDQRADMTNVIRGAAYVPERPVDT